MIQMGLGPIGGPNVNIKRKYRWTFKVDYCNGTIPESLVKSGSRPNLTIEETEINYLHGKTWIPGKGTWETITVTYIDASGLENGGIEHLFGWLATVYDFTDPVNLHQSSRVGNGGYGGVATLKMYDGCGQEMETWEMGHVWPQSVNFGELDFASSEEATIELTLRYSNVSYTSHCGIQIEPCPCVGCPQ